MGSEVGSLYACESGGGEVRYRGFEGPSFYYRNPVVNVVVIGGAAGQGLGRRRECSVQMASGTCNKRVRFAKTGGGWVAGISSRRLWRRSSNRKE